MKFMLNLLMCSLVVVLATAVLSVALDRDEQVHKAEMQRWAK